MFYVDGADEPTMRQAVHQSERTLVGSASVNGHPVVGIAVAVPTTPEVLDTFLASAMKTADEFRRNTREKHGT
ncbi:MAG: hypothetical protein ACJAR2_002524 [Ilumatobacter sp.]|jgi:hypothetical protein